MVMLWMCICILTWHLAWQAKIVRGSKVRLFCPSLKTKSITSTNTISSPCCSIPPDLPPSADRSVSHPRLNDHLSIGIIFVVQTHVSCRFMRRNCPRATGWLLVCQLIAGRHVLCVCVCVPPYVRTESMLHWYLFASVSRSRDWRYTV